MTKIGILRGIWSFWHILQRLTYSYNKHQTSPKIYVGILYSNCRKLKIRKILKKSEGRNKTMYLTHRWSRIITNSLETRWTELEWNKTANLELKYSEKVFSISLLPGSLGIGLKSNNPLIVWWFFLQPIPNLKLSKDPPRVT